MQVLQWLGSLLVGVISVSVIAFSIINVEELSFNFYTQKEHPPVQVNINVGSETAVMPPMPATKEHPPVQVNINVDSETAVMPPMPATGEGIENLPPQRYRVPVTVDCEGKTAYECQRLQQMQAMARLSEQHRTQVSRQSLSVNDQLVQDVISTRSQGVVTDVTVEKNGQHHTVEGTVH